MIPIDQEFIHAPESYIYGDCQRACIASLLELPLQDVPHFYETGNEAEYFESMNTFLANKGLFHLEVHPSYPFDNPKFCSQLREATDVYHMIYGRSLRGFLHAVVGRNGIIVHDPHPDKTGLDERYKNDWHHAFLVNACN